MQSPFLTYRDLLLDAHYGTIERLRRIVLNLYNEQAYPTVALGSFLAGADEKHTRMLLEMLEWYGRYIENDPHFLSLGEELVKLYRQDIESD